MKKPAALLLAFSIMIIFSSCGNSSKEGTPVDIEPQLSQMQSICELAVMECYYHNVAKFLEEDASGILWWKKDKRFWIEYSGIVKYGIKTSLVNMKTDDSQITITLPKAEVLSCMVDSTSLTKDSYIVDKNSADIEAADETYALAEAQKRLEELAANDEALLAEAQRRVQTLLQDYVTNISNASGKTYTIKWIYVDENGNQVGTDYSSSLSESGENATQENQENQ